MKRLDFIGIGAQKAGTTWLYKMLDLHPQVSFGKKKEICFFNDNKSFYNRQIQGNFHKGLGWYYKQLDLKEGYVNGEISPDYMWDEKAAKRIKKYFPRTKIIAILRNPVDRAYSHYQFASQKYFVGRSFEEGMQKYPEFLERGLYYRQLKRYLDLFSHEQIKIVIFENIVKDPESVLFDIEDFLGIERFIPDTIGKKENVTRSARSISLLRLVTHIHSIKTTWVGRLLWRNRYFIKVIRSLNRGLRRINLKNNERVPIPDSTRKKLYKYYRKDINMLEDAIGIDLSLWREDEKIKKDKS